MNLLLQLTLRGSIVALAVLALDRALATRMAARSRRWWWLFIPVGYLVPAIVPMLMITRYSERNPRVLLAAAVTLILAAIAQVTPVRAAGQEPKAAAVAAMQPWLKEIDAGQYVQSWKDASQMFQTAITADKWAEALQGVRGGLGAVKSRTLASAALQKDPMQGTRTIKGEFVVAQFESSFENMKHVVETVSFDKEPDGAWRAAGYYLRPGP